MAHHLIQSKKKFFWLRINGRIGWEKRSFVMIIISLDMIAHDRFEPFRPKSRTRNYRTQNTEIINKYVNASRSCLGYFYFGDLKSIESGQSAE